MTLLAGFWLLALWNLWSSFTAEKITRSSTALEYSPRAWPHVFAAFVSEQNGLAIHRKFCRDVLFGRMTTVKREAFQAQSLSEHMRFAFKHQLVAVDWRYVKEKPRTGHWSVRGFSNNEMRMPD